MNLAPGQLTPLLQEGVVRLGSQVPFRQAARLFAFFQNSYVSEATVRRTTQAAGRVYEPLQTDASAVPASASPEVMQRQIMSADGAMVPLVGGEWAEVKSVAIGQVEEPVLEKGEWVVHSSQLSYFSRLTDAATFSALAHGEVARRATAQAATVVAVSDGALWIQAFFDEHCPDAVRILDFPHASAALARASHAFFAGDPLAAATWFATQRQKLRDQTPQCVLDALLALALEAYDQAQPQDVQDVLHESWAYLTKRKAMLRYAHFQQLGYPIGSGAIESANKVVVERRLKGAGMHWARASVNPMLALTNLHANQRWEEAWPAILTERRHAQRAPHTTALTTPPLAETLPSEPAPPKPPYRPSQDHPWRKPFLPRSARHDPDPPK